MLQAVLSYILIFITLFLGSIGISFTILSSYINSPETTKYRLLQQKKIVNGFLRNYNKISSTQDSLKRELIYKRINLQQEIILTDSLLEKIELNRNRLNNSEKLILKNSKKLSKTLK